MSEPTQVSEAEFDAKVIKSPLPALVDFWAEWCGPCRMIAPLVHELAGELDGKLNVFKVDVDACPGLAEKFGIQSIPTLLLFKEGKPVRQIVGLTSKADLARTLAEAGVS